MSHEVQFSSPLHSEIWQVMGAESTDLDYRGASSEQKKTKIRHGFRSKENIKSCNGHSDGVGFEMILFKPKRG